MLLFGVVIDLAVRVIIEPYNDLKELSLLLIIIVRGIIAKQFSMVDWQMLHLIWEHL